MNKEKKSHFIKELQCRLCGKTFTRKSTERKRYCNVCINSNKRNTNHYKRWKKIKPCKNCRKDFFGTYRQVLCKTCKENLPNPLIHHYEKIRRKVICEKCGKIIKYETVKNSFRTKPEKKIICKTCNGLELKENLQILRKIISEERKKLNQRLRYKKRREQRNIKKETPDETRDRMRKNNPMHREEVRKKVRKTLQEKIKNGKIIYVRGHAHHAYKGNRNFSNECRKWLKEWKRKVLERDKFHCVKCGVSGNLHIHHISPLRSFIKKVLDENHIENIEKIKIEDIDYYEKLVLEVVKLHKLRHGISVCKQCHANIDDRYRRVKKRIKNEN